MIKSLIPFCIPLVVLGLLGNLWVRGDAPCQNQKPLIIPNAFCDAPVFAFFTCNNPAWGVGDCQDAFATIHSADKEVTENKIGTFCALAVKVQPAGFVGPPEKIQRYCSSYMECDYDINIRACVLWRISVHNVDYFIEASCFPRRHNDVTINSSFTAATNTHADE